MSTELRLVVKMIQTTEVVKNVRECLSKAKKKKNKRTEYSNNDISGSNRIQFSPLKNQS